MKRNRTRNSVAQVQGRNPTTSSRNTSPSRKKSVTRKFSAKDTAVGPSTPKTADVTAPSSKQPSPVHSRDSSPGATPVLTAPEASTPPTDAVQPSPERTPSPSSSPSQKPPLGNGKRTRKEEHTPLQSADTFDKKRVSLPFSSPPDASKDATNNVNSAAVSSGSLVPAVSSKVHGNASTSLVNSSSSAMSRGNSIRLSPSTSPAPPHNLLSPVNEIHGSLAQLYLTPITASLSSSSPQPGFTALHFDGRSASWRSGGVAGNSQAAAAAAASASAASAAGGGVYLSGHRRGSGSVSSAPRPRNCSFGDNSSGPRHSADSGSGVLANDDSFTSGQHAQPAWGRQRGTSGASAARTRNNVHAGADARPRPTFSPDGNAEASVGAAAATSLNGPQGQLYLAEPAEPTSATLSATNTSLFATTATVAVPTTPPFPPPLRSTITPSSSSAAARRLPPTPPPLDGGGNVPFAGYSTAEEGDGSGSGSGSDGRRSSWNLASSWAPAGSSPTSSAQSSTSPPVVKAARRVSRSGAGGGGAGGSAHGRSDSVLELAEDPFVRGHDDGDAAAPARRGSQRYQSETTGSATANSRTTAAMGANEHFAGASVSDVSPNESSVFSVSFASTATSMFDEQPPPPPAPPAQLFLGAKGNNGGRNNVPAAAAAGTAAALSLPPRAPAMDQSASLFLDNNVWHGRDQPSRNSSSASFSVRQASMASVRPFGDDKADGAASPLMRHGSFFSTSHASLTQAEPFTLTPSTSSTTPAPQSGKAPTTTATTATPGEGQDDGGSPGLVRHGASYGVQKGSWSDLRKAGRGGGGNGPPPLSLDPSVGSRSSRAATEAAGKGDAQGAPTSVLPAPSLSIASGEESETDPFDTEGQQSQPPTTAPAPPPEPSLVVREQTSTAARLSVKGGEEVASRQQELAQSFRNRIQVGVRAPRRKQTVRRVSANSRDKRRGSSGGSGDSSSGSQRSSSGRSGSSGSGSRRRSGSSRRGGSRSSTPAGTSAFTFIRTCFLMLACAKFMKAAIACRARHQYAEVDAPRAAFVIQCAWRRRLQRRRIRQRNAAQLLVPWARLHLQQLRKTKEVSALLLQRVFRGQVVRSFHQFLYSRMQYNKALDVVLRAVRRWEAQKMLFGLRLQRDEREVLLEQYVQGCRQILRAEQLEWTSLVDKATALLGSRPSVTTRDWVAGVAARTGLLLNPTTTTSPNDHLFEVVPRTKTNGGDTAAPSRTETLRDQLTAIAQLESYAYLRRDVRSTKAAFMRSGMHATAATTASVSASATPRLSDVHSSELSAALTNDTAGTERALLNATMLPLASMAEFDERPLMSTELSRVAGAPAVTDDDVVDAYVQLLIRIESAERMELERDLLRQHEAVLHHPSLVNQAVAYIVQQQLPLLFAPLLLSMTSAAMMRLAVNLFAAERAARSQIITMYESMPLAFLSRPMLNPAAGQRHNHLVQLTKRAADPWFEAEQNERRLYQEWNHYQQRSTYGTSDTKSITSPPPAYLQPYNGSPLLIPIVAEESSGHNAPQLGSVTPAPVFLETSPNKDRPLSTQSSMLSPRPTHATASGGAGTGLRVRMTASLRSAVSASAPQSVPSVVLTPGFTGSVSISAAPSDSYTRVDMKSKTAVPCPKRRPRGPPLPMLRKLVPATTSAKTQSRLSRRPSFQNSFSFLANESRLRGRSPETHPHLHSTADIPTVVYNAPSSDHADRPTFSPTRPSSTSPTAHRLTAVAMPSSSTVLGTPLVEPLEAPAFSDNTPPYEEGLDRPLLLPTTTTAIPAAVANLPNRNSLSTTAAAVPAALAPFRLDSLGSQASIHRIRKALELHHLSIRTDGADHDDDADMSARLSAVWAPSSPNRAERRDTVAPLPALSSAIFPLQGPPAVPAAASGSGSHNDATAAGPLTGRLSQVRVLPWGGDSGGDFGTVSFGTNLTSSSSSAQRTGGDGAQSFASFSLGNEQASGIAETGTHLPPPPPPLPAASFMTGENGRQSRASSVSSTTTSSSLASSSVDSTAELYRAAAAAAADRQRAANARQLPRRPPTPPPRRCHAVPSSASLASASLSRSPSSKATFEAVETGIFDSAAAAAALTPRQADAVAQEPARGSAAVLPAVQRPSSGESSVSSNTNWTLSPMIKTLPVSPPPQTASTQLPPLSGPQPPKRAFAGTL